MTLKDLKNVYKSVLPDKVDKVLLKDSKDVLKFTQYLTSNVSTTAAHSCFFIVKQTTHSFRVGRSEMLFWNEGLTVSSTITATTHIKRQLILGENSNEIEQAGTGPSRRHI